MSSVYLSASTQERNLGKDGITEEARMQALTSDVAALLRKYNVTVYLNDPKMEIMQVVYDSNAKRPNIHVALHSNAGGGSGTETWCWPSGTDKLTSSEKLAIFIQNEVVSALGLPDRGLEDGSPKGKKKAEVADTRATACLIELFFHDNAADIERFKAKRGEVVTAIVAGILRYFGFTAALADLRKPTVAAPDYTALHNEIAQLKRERDAAIAEVNEWRVVATQAMNVLKKKLGP